MRPTLFTLFNEFNAAQAKREIDRLPKNGSVEILMRRVVSQKTMRQLGMLFGAWEGVFSQEWGIDKDDVHTKLKRMFLERIYIVNPVTVEQEMWVELYHLLKENNLQDRLIKHRLDISLGWANLKQTKLFMDDISTMAINENIYLPNKDDLMKLQYSERAQERAYG